MVAVIRRTAMKTHMLHLTIQGTCARGPETNLRCVRSLTARWREVHATKVVVIVLLARLRWAAPRHAPEPIGQARPKSTDRITPQSGNSPTHRAFAPYAPHADRPLDVAGVDAVLVRVITVLEARYEPLWRAIAL